MSTRWRDSYPPPAEAQVPTRRRVTDWNGECRFCLKNDVKDGDIIVQMKGQGWWHDQCFRVVHPSYYLGLGNVA